MLAVRINAMFNTTVRALFCWGVMFWCYVSVVWPQTISKYTGSDAGRHAMKASTVSWAKRYLQGYNMKVWMNNQLKFGIDVAPSLNDIGLEYPAGSRNEHLYVGGPVIGGIVNGTKRVTSAWWFANEEFVPNLSDTARDRFWITSASDTLLDPSRFGFYKRSMNKREIDDDGDGRIDEDELDGMDNDGDWDPLTDDVGADGLPDSLETGCHGGYDPVTNPDPAFDNYDPANFDRCHPDATGGFRRKNHRDLYTEHNGIPDHGEPHVDEDFAAISDNDVYCTSTDTFSIPTYANHLPLGIKVWQKSYAWRGKFADGILPFDYYFVNVGRNTITDIYIGWMGDPDVGPVATGGYYTHDFSAYIPELHTAYMHNSADRGATPFGVTVLSTPKPLEQLNYTFQWYTGNSTPSDNVQQYDWMSCGAFNGNCLVANQPPTLTADSRMFLSFGPFASLHPGDTLKISLAYVSGTGLQEGAGNMVDNIKNVLKLYSGGFRSPVVPVSPCVTVVPGDRRVTVSWGRSVLCSNGNIGIDPFSVWDDSNKIAESYPPDHWRRANPPNGHTRGGRIFEGYRLYRSEDPDGTLNSFSLLKEFDIDDEFNYNRGLDSVFVDSNLVLGKKYWYAVTAFGLPDRLILSSTASGSVQYDTLLTAGSESSLDDNRASVQLTFAPSARQGEVLVVPNPYRVDRDYTFENGGWEGRGRSWTENSRKLKFIHLPPKCTIRVFTISGELVVTLGHDDPVRGELEWNLLSDSDRALASGVYIFSVDSDYGTQIGKFVLIR
jgi:hypothetical protein